MNASLQRINDDISLIETELERVLSKGDTSYPKLFEAIRYSVGSGGKRIRPVLTLEFCRLFGGDIRKALPLAAAIELIHTYSLIHDDLPCMDNDDMRRGRPTNHKVFGEATAILAGDGLLTHAFSVISESDVLDADTALSAVRLLSHSAGIYGMVGGQQMDMDMDSSDAAVSKTEHEKMNALKTGRLISCAAMLGCIAAKATNEQKEAAKRYADALGLAFQITDDILDDGEEDEKKTFLSFYSLEEAEKYAAELTQKAIDAVKPYENSEFLISLATYLCQRKA